MALLDGDTPLLGVIDQPVTGERWVGVTGRPTVFRGPFGGRAGCRPCPALGEAELSCTSPDMFPPDSAPGWRRLAGQVRRVSWGGDCYAYGLLALGQIDVVAEASLKVWDWAALLPVIEGAGGRMTDWQGRPLRADGRARRSPWATRPCSPPPSQPSPADKEPPDHAPPLALLALLLQHPPPMRSPLTPCR